MKAAKFVEDRCDAVDLNLGCPQGIAKKGFYGSFLQDEWELIASIVKKLHENLKVPVTCKIRIFPEVEKTIRYAKMLEAAGCQLLTVHGRTRDQRAQLTGLADWEQIKMVKEAVSIPVFSNGNILYYEDVQKCLDYTGCEGVMTAEGNLYNPFIFEPGFPLMTQVCREFIDAINTYGAIAGHVRGHFFKILRPALTIHTDFRSRLGSAQGVEALIAVVEELLVIVQKEYEEAKAIGKEMEGVEELNVPHWFCQPYFRPPPTEIHGKSTKKREAPETEAESPVVEPPSKDIKLEEVEACKA